MAFYTYDELREYGTVVWSTGPDELVTWNGSATFNVWHIVGKSHAWVNTDVFTVYGITSEAAARMAARSRFADMEG